MKVDYPVKGVGIYIKAWYYTKDPCFDDYTVVLNWKGKKRKDNPFAKDYRAGNWLAPCLNMTSEGLCGHGDCVEGSHLGTRKAFEDLPEAIQKAIIKEIQEYVEIDKQVKKHKEKK
jgi:hypothetical protein